MKAKIRFLLAAIMLLAGTTNARAQSITVQNGQVRTLSSDMTCTNFSVYQGTLIVNQGVTLTLDSYTFDLYDNSTIELHGTMTGSVSGSNWNSNSYINVYLRDGAKYIIGVSCDDGDSYLRYFGYNAGTDGHGTVTVTDNSSNTVTDGSLGYRTTTYTFTATPNSGYRFVNWTKGAGGEVLGTAASIAVTCQENGWYQVYANFEEDVPAVPHTVRFAAGNDGWSVQDVTASASATAPAILQNVMAGDSLVVTAPATLPGKVKSVKAVKYVPPVLVQSIVLDKQTASLGKDSTMTLSVASVLPENAADKSYSWSSDATGVASVNENGVVTGHNAGTANIIATANDGSGAKDTCVVTVIVLQPVILDGVTVLYASDNDRWETVVGYNQGVLYLDGGDVRLTSNNAFLFYEGNPVHSIDFISPLDYNEYQWLRVLNIYSLEFYYHQGETWQEAIDANRMFNQDWSIENGQVKVYGNQILVDNTTYEPVDPTATIDPSTVNYDFIGDN